MSAPLMSVLVMIVMIVMIVVIVVIVMQLVMPGLVLNNTNVYNLRPCSARMRRTAL